MNADGTLDPQIIPGAPQLEFEPNPEPSGCTESRLRIGDPLRYATLNALVTTTIHYINTDLDLVAAFDLAVLSEALSSAGLLELHMSEHDDGLWYATFEAGAQFDEPEETMAALLSAIDSLDAESQQLWSACRSRVFNIGYESGDEPRSFRNSVSHSVLERVVATNASLHITLYAPDRRPPEPPDEVAPESHNPATEANGE